MIFFILFLFHLDAIEGSYSAQFLTCCLCTL